MRDHVKKLAAIALALTTISGFTVSHAAGNLPAFKCTLTDQVDKDDNAGPAKDTYSVATPEIFLICDSANVTKGQSVKAEWIAVDTNNAAPANYKIDEKTLAVESDASDSNIWHASLSLTKPNKGWPVGSYRVDLMVNGEVDQSFKFTVK